MPPETPYDPRISVWNTYRNLVLALGHEIHERLNEATTVSIHGRDLRPEDEGVGFQFQYMLTGEQTDQEIHAAFYVLQMQLKKRKASIGWTIDAIPVTEKTAGEYALEQRRSFEVSLHQHERLRTVMLEDITNDARGFFADVLTGAQRSIEAVSVSSRATDEH